MLGSVRGAPGVTTTAVLLARCLDSGVVAEADVNGSVLALRYGLGRQPGLTTLAADRSDSPDTWRRHAQEIDETAVLIGPDRPELAAALWSRAGTQLARSLAVADADVVVDAGRLGADSPLGPVLAAASVLAVLVRPEAEDLTALAHRLGRLRAASGKVGVVLVGNGTYLPGHIGEQLDVEILAVLPGDVHRALRDTQRLGRRGSVAAHELGLAVRALARSLVAETGPVPDGAQPDSTSMPTAAVTEVRT